MLLLLWSQVWKFTTRLDLIRTSWSSTYLSIAFPNVFSATKCSITKTFLIWGLCENIFRLFWLFMFCCLFRNVSGCFVIKKSNVVWRWICCLFILKWVIDGELMYWVNCVIGFIFGSLNYVNSVSSLSHYKWC